MANGRSHGIDQRERFVPVVRDSRCTSIDRLRRLLRSNHKLLQRAQEAGAQLRRLDDQVVDCDIHRQVDARNLLDCRGLNGQGGERS